MELVTKFAEGGFAVSGAEIEATLSYVNKVDTEKDRMMPGCFDEAIKDFNGSLSMKWMHQRGEIIGVWKELRMDGDRLVGKGDVFDDVGRGADAIKLMERGVVKGVSIGFRARDRKSLRWAKDRGGIDFANVIIGEASLVDKAAMPGADILELRRKMADEAVAEDNGKSLTVDELVAKAAAYGKHMGDEVHKRIALLINA